MMKRVFSRQRSLLLVLLVFAGCAQAGPLRSTLPETQIPYDRAWKVALDASLNYYDRIAVEDKEGGFFQTTWNIHKVGLVIGSPVRRSRLIGRVASKAPFRLDLALEQEAFSLELGRWVSETPDERFFSQIAQDMRARLQF